MRSGKTSARQSWFKTSAFSSTPNSILSASRWLTPRLTFRSFLREMTLISQTPPKWPCASRRLSICSLRKSLSTKWTTLTESRLLRVIQNTASIYFKFFNRSVCSIKMVEESFWTAKWFLTSSTMMKRKKTNSRSKICQLQKVKHHRPQLTLLMRTLWTKWAQIKEALAEIWMLKITKITALWTIWWSFGTNLDRMLHPEVKNFWKLLVRIRMNLARLRIISRMKRISWKTTSDKGNTHNKCLTMMN